MHDSIKENYSEYLKSINEDITDDILKKLSSEKMKIMYGTQNTNNIISNTIPSVNIIATTADSYVLVIEDQKIQIPTMKSYQKLTEENNKLKANHTRLYQESKRLFGVVKVLTGLIHNMEEELQQKVDKYDSDTGL